MKEGHDFYKRINVPLCIYKASLSRICRRQPDSNPSSSSCYCCNQPAWAEELFVIWLCFLTHYNEQRGLGDAATAVTC